MTINWYRPSQCVLILVTISSILVFLGSLTCGFLLHFAPEEPSDDVSGGMYMSIPTIALLGAAVLTALALIIGCCGACRDSKIGLATFAILSLVVAGVLLGSMATVFTFTMKGTIENKLRGVMQKDLEAYDGSSDSLYHTIQQNYKCCGVDNYSDWRALNTTWKRKVEDESILAPTVCCVANTTNCTSDHIKLWSKGCLEVLFGRLKVVVYSVFGCSLLLALLQILSAMFACYGAILIQRYQSYDIL